MKDKNTIEIGVKATGFEEAAEQMELMADAMNQFPATVNIKAKDCEIGIHTHNYIVSAEPEPSQVKGGVILEPVLDQEQPQEKGETVLPIGTINEMFMMDFLKKTKKKCEERTTCQGCILKDENGGCKVVADVPAYWKI